MHVCIRFATATAALKLQIDIDVINFGHSESEICTSDTHLLSWTLSTNKLNNPLSNGKFETNFHFISNHFSVPHPHRSEHVLDFRLRKSEHIVVRRGEERSNMFT